VLKWAVRAIRWPWQAEALEPAAAGELERERVEISCRRMRVIAPIMVVVHALHVWHFHASPAERALLAPDVLRWRDGLVAVHAATLPFTFVLALLAFFVRAPRLLRWLGPVAAAGYMVHGAAIASYDQIVVANMTAYVAYCFGVAMFVPLRPLESVVAYVLGLTVLVVGVLALSTSAAGPRTNLPTASTLTLVSVVLSWIVEGARRREWSQRRTIARQREELAALNVGLERRVEEQVRELSARAAQAERLNTELQAQVRARSTELSQALSRLAQQMSEQHGLEPGAVIGGRFEIEGVLGEGGMGAVYAGVDRSTGARVAIKVLQAASSQQLDVLRRFIREAGTTATVSHPAIVRMLHVDVSDDGLVFQVQELVEGETLARRLGRPWPPGHAARLGQVLCEALAAAHAEGVIHRDVKPENIMLTPAPPGLKLVDFGIAKLYDAVVAEGSTMEAVALGTPAYMAPEQVTAGATVGERADVYAAGVILYQLLTTRLPVDAPTARELMARKLSATILTLPEAPAPLALAVCAALAPTASARPSATELATKLRAIADELGAPPLEDVQADASVTPAVTRAERRLRTP
jgi:hypothetical protein